MPRGSLPAAGTGAWNGDFHVEPEKSSRLVKPFVVVVVAVNSKKALLIAVRIRTEMHAAPSKLKPDSIRSAMGGDQLYGKRERRGPARSLDC